MTPNPACMYLSRSHREALAGLTYAILGQKGFVLLTGDAGIGKTTLIARCLQHLPDAKVRTSLIVTPTVAPNEFLELVMLNFGIVDVPASKAARLYAFREFLVKADSSGQIPLLVIDEAHTLDGDVLEEIRLLGNFEGPDKKLLHIVLAGQTELKDLLDRRDLRQLKQRLAVRLHVDPLTQEERGEYMRFRWQKAGGGELPFHPDAVEAVSRVSAGVPRVINAVCDNALILAMAERQREVAGSHVLAACADLGLRGAPQRAAAPPSGAANGKRRGAAAGAREGKGAGAPVAADPVAAPQPFSNLQRQAPPPKVSRLMRWAQKIGLAQ